MADRSPNRILLFLRFVALLLLGLMIDALLFHLLLNAALGPLLARTLSLLAALAITLALLHRIDLTAHNRLSIERPGLAAILIIAAILNQGLYATLVTALPSLQPLAAMALASTATLCFAIFGYLRFASRK
ncbi:GtrA family protein [Rhizobium sullae]|uniref:Uncharacterized protein n=1 Tax=Rhizobium sullae TaxID=50338 RepID=A0A4R3QJ62_RHISU|nr:GtrA family protein [Rhizobium sullae]TCU18286.1 hypothetical protein EV132_103406 [Rhizobium sullae]